MLVGRPISRDAGENAQVSGPAHRGAVEAGPPFLHAGARVPRSADSPACGYGLTIVAGRVGAAPGLVEAPLHAGGEVGEEPVDVVRAGAAGAAAARATGSAGWR